MPTSSLVSQNPVTLQDVARHLGVSNFTVSAALSGKGRVSAITRQNVLKAAQELGYEPNVMAQGLVYGRAQNTIDLFSAFPYRDTNYNKIELIQSLLNEKGFQVPLHSRVGFTPPRVAPLIAQLRLRRPLAIICSTWHVYEDALAELHRYQAEGGHVVCYDTEMESGCDEVIFDANDNTYQAARHLLEAGHRDIGLCLQIPDPPTSVDTRLRGFQRALKEFGAAFKSEWVFYGAYEEEAGASMAHKFLAMQKRPTGLCVVNDVASSVFINQVMRAGLTVPKDVSIVGHDDEPAARYCIVPLTTVTHPSEQIARAVVGLLEDRLSGAYTGPPRHIKVRGELIQRESVAPR